MHFIMPKISTGLFGRQTAHTKYSSEENTKNSVHPKNNTTIHILNNK